MITRRPTFQSTLPIREETPARMARTISVLFQSTLPIREETPVPISTPTRAANFNPLFPYGKRPTDHGRGGAAGKFQSTLPIREETLPPRSGHRAGFDISIHSSHTGRDSSSVSLGYPQMLFQSTLPIREETARQPEPHPARGISIHSSHTGRDCAGPS